MRHFTTREYGQLQIGRDKREIPEEFAKHLLRASRESPLAGKNREGVLFEKQNCLHANGIVGIVATNTCQLEILPKIKFGGENEEDKKVSRLMLIDMLSLVYNLKISVKGTEKLATDSNTILEVIIRKFCEKLINLVRYGLPRSYITQYDDLTKLRGTLNVNRQFSHLILSPQKLACSFDELSPNVTINRIIGASIRKLSGMAKSEHCKSMLKKLLVVYSEVEDLKLRKFDWDSVEVNRIDHCWKELLGYAKLILGNDFQSAGIGESWGFSLLFEMNKLFEKYIAKLLKLELRDYERDVAFQSGDRYCLKEIPTGKSTFLTVPDIVIKSSKRTLDVIVDTKWKVMSGDPNEAKNRVNQADVYQMMAYQRVYGCNAVLLLYPYNSALERDGVFKSYEIAPFNDGEARLYVATLDISKSRIHQRMVLRSIVNECITSVQPSEVRED